MDRTVRRLYPAREGLRTIAAAQFVRPVSPDSLHGGEAPPDAGGRAGELEPEIAPPEAAELDAGVLAGFEATGGFFRPVSHPSAIPTPRSAAATSPIAT